MHIMASFYFIIWIHPLAGTHVYTDIISPTHTHTHPPTCTHLHEYGFLVYLAMDKWSSSFKLQITGFQRLQRKRADKSFEASVRRGCRNPFPEPASLRGHYQKLFGGLQLWPRSSAIILASRLSLASHSWFLAHYFQPGLLQVWALQSWGHQLSGKPRNCPYAWLRCRPHLDLL